MDHYYYYGSWDLFASNGIIKLHNAFDHEYKFVIELYTIGM